MFSSLSRPWVYTKYHYQLYPVVSKVQGRQKKHSVLSMFCIIRNFGHWGSRTDYLRRVNKYNSLHSNQNN